MKTNRKLGVWIGVVLAIVVILAAGWYFLVLPSGSLSADLTTAWESLVNPATTVSSGTLNASGTVETTVLSIASQVPGKVLEVDFQEGEVIKDGAVLVHLDDSTLKIQRTIAAANLESAKLSLQQLASPTVIANLQKTIAQDKQAIEDAQQAQDIEKYFTTNTDAIQSARSNLYLAKKALDRALTEYDKVDGDPNYTPDKAAAYQKLYPVQLAYDNALAVLNLWTGVPNQEQVDLKAATLAQANAKLVEDQTLLDVLNGDPIPDNATGAGIVKLQQARINVQAAQANLDLLEDEIARMTITAPVDGVVMTRSVDPGNVVNPGIELLSLARLNDLTITVYIPEDIYTKINLGQTATVTVDSYPGETFNAAVVYISKQPVFIPRTAQTESGNRSMLYAIQLSLTGVNGKLKPGMAADVTFNSK
ncbi:MAG: efflux RND transporter periplasmic adaptor subunit [Anaerolineales bacterium]|jgi:HlyD family secretion protein